MATTDGDKKRVSERASKKCPKSLEIELAPSHLICSLSITRTHTRDTSDRSRFHNPARETGSYSHDDDDEGEDEDDDESGIRAQLSPLH